jgi:hypothetical protein
MRFILRNPRWITVSFLAVMICGGCASNKHITTGISPSFYGVWTNLYAGNFNWWEIDASGVVNYGIALDAGNCGARRAVVLGPDSINVPLGNSGTAKLRISGDLLILEGTGGRAAHKRVNRKKYLSED